MCVSTGGSVVVKFHTPGLEVLQQLLFAKNHACIVCSTTYYSLVQLLHIIRTFRNIDYVCFVVVGGWAGIWRLPA